MADVSEATFTSSDKLKKYLFWLTKLKDSDIVGNMATIFVEEMMASGKFDDAASIVGSFTRLIGDAAAIHEHINSGQHNTEGFFVTSNQTDKKIQAKKCVEIFLEIIPDLNTHIENFRWYLTRSINGTDINDNYEQHVKYNWSAGYSEYSGYVSPSYGKRYTMDKMLSNYGFQDITVSDEQVKYLLSLLKSMVDGTSHTHINSHSSYVQYRGKYDYNQNDYDKALGLQKLTELCMEIKKTREEHRKHCRRPPLRDLLLMVADVCTQASHEKDKKEMLFRDVEFGYAIRESKNTTNEILYNVCYYVDDLEKRIFKRIRGYSALTQRQNQFEEKLEYLIRSVHYLEEYIKEIRALIVKFRNDNIQYDNLKYDDVMKYLNQGGYVSNDVIDDKIYGSVETLVGLVGEPDPYEPEYAEEGWLTAVVDVLSASFYERAYKSTTQPHSMKERFIWLISLYWDSRHHLPYYNLKRSLLIEKFTKKMEDGKLDANIGAVRQLMYILPIKVLKTYLELTGDSRTNYNVYGYNGYGYHKPIPYGYYEGTIFTEKYADDYADIFTKIILELLRDLEYVTFMTSEKMPWKDMKLGYTKHANTVTEGAKTEAVSGQKHEQESSEIEQKNENDPKEDEMKKKKREELEALKKDLWTDEEPLFPDTGGPWRDILKRTTSEYFNPDKSGLDNQMHDWFVYQGFRPEELRDYLEAKDVNRILTDLFNNKVSVETLYKYIWLTFDDSLEKFLIPPSNLKEMMDWIGKLDENEQEYYNAGQCMIIRLREMGGMSASKASKTLSNLIYSICSLRRVLLEDPDDYGKYNEAFAMQPASNHYLVMLGSMIPKLEKSLEEMRNILVPKGKASRNADTEQVKDEDTCVVKHTKFMELLVKQGFKPEEIHDECQFGHLYWALENMGDHRDLDHLKHSATNMLSIIKPKSFMDMIEWSYALKTKAPSIEKRIGKDIYYDVYNYISGNHVTEMANLYYKFMRLVPQIRETMRKVLDKPSNYENASFENSLYGAYKDIVKQIINDIYEHYTRTKVTFFEDASKEIKYLIIEKTDKTQLMLVDGSAEEIQKVKEVKTEVEQTLSQIFTVDAGDTHSLALNTYMALLQGAPLASVAKEGMSATTACCVTGGAVAASLSLLHIAYKKFVGSGLIPIAESFKKLKSAIGISSSTVAT